jgi:single-stranded-DNA-specific exonuclease
METELANARRKALQKDVTQQVKAKLDQLDLSTTSVIVLTDTQWPVGILGLVAGQVAHEYSRPTILLNVDTPSPELLNPGLAIARGSARSVHQIDLYQLVKDQEPLLHRFGGHPFAAGLSLPVENIPLFTEAINQQLRQQNMAAIAASHPVIQADLVVKVADLGKDLFRELKLLEPCGMGNPAPKLLIQNCWFENLRNQNIRDLRGQKLRYIKTEFEIWDDSIGQRHGSVAIGFPGVWWEHYREDIPQGRCDAIAELDYNAYSKRYEIRLIAVRSCLGSAQIEAATQVDWILDWRQAEVTPVATTDSILPVTQCPLSWDDWQTWFRRALQQKQKLAIAYSSPQLDPPQQTWQQLLGIAKYLSRTGQTATHLQLQAKLKISDRSLHLGLQTLTYLGFEFTYLDQALQTLQMTWTPPIEPTRMTSELAQLIEQFLAAVREEQFHRQYFYTVPLSTIQAMATQVILNQKSLTPSR